MKLPYGLEREALVWAWGPGKMRGQILTRGFLICVLLLLAYVERNFPLFACSVIVMGDGVFFYGMSFLAFKAADEADRWMAVVDSILDTEDDALVMRVRAMREARKVVVNQRETLH